MAFRSIISIIVKGLGWLLIAALVGTLIASRTSTGVGGLAAGSGGLLVAALLGRWIGRRWVLKSARYFWVPAVLLLLAGLFLSVRNTPLGVIPVHIIALATGAVALAVAMFGVLRYQGQGAMWRAVVMVFASLGLLGLAGYDATMAYRTEAVLVDNDGVQLEGTILVPRGTGPFPTVVFVHGAGPELRSASRPLADRFARAGFVTLVWDKRGSGASIGGSPHDPFPVLASDVAAWVEFLQDRNEVDQGQIVLWGSSEGAWVAPLAAEQAAVSALVLVSLGVQFGETLYYQKSWELRRAGYTEAEIDEAIGLRRSINDYYRTGSDRDQVLSDIAAVANAAWYLAAVDNGLLPTEEVVAEPGTPESTEFLAMVDFTLLTSLGKFEGPVLAAFGLQDKCTPSEDNAILVGDFLDQQGNDYLILEYPDAGHGILSWATGEVFCGGGISPVSYPVDYLDAVESWIVESLGLAD